MLGGEIEFRDWYWLLIILLRASEASLWAGTSASWGHERRGDERRREEHEKDRRRETRGHEKDTRYERAREGTRGHANFN